MLSISVPSICSLTCQRRVEPSGGWVPGGLAAGEEGTTQGPVAVRPSCGRDILTLCADPPWELASNRAGPFADGPN